MTRHEQQLRIERFEREALQHLDILLKTANRIAGPLLNAEDVVQETYLRAWKHFDSFESGTNCRAWLFRIMFNVIKARGGTLAKRPETHVEDEGAIENHPGNVVFFDPQPFYLPLAYRPLAYREDRVYSHLGNRWRLHEQTGRPGPRRLGLAYSEDSGIGAAPFLYCYLACGAARGGLRDAF
jgi:RNA polymerase sigma factor (sigma-70 family)